jgi:hypothetical protein
VFVGSLISAILIRGAADKYEVCEMLAEIDRVTEYFTVVTSNLESQYLHACECINAAFETKNTKQLLEAIEQLIEGYGKNN